METGTANPTPEAPNRPFHQSDEWLKIVRLSRGKFTKAQRKEIARDVVGNDLAYQVAAKKYRTSVGTISRIVKNHRHRRERKASKAPTKAKSRGSASRHKFRVNRIHELGLLTVYEAAELLNMTADGVRRAVHDGRLKAERLFGETRGGHNAFKLEEVERFNNRGLILMRRVPAPKSAPQIMTTIPTGPKIATGFRLETFEPASARVTVEGLRRRIEALETDVALLKKALR